MPELAEVEFYRQQWNRGLGADIRAVHLHAAKRIFRGIETSALKKSLPGCLLLRSEAHGKQMLFRFSNNVWLGLHLGMTGKLRLEKAGFQPGKHDHLVLLQEHCSLVFSDPRQFGRVRFHLGLGPPDWWSNLPAPLNSEQFTVATLKAFLEQHRKLPLKAALLLQSGFPGLGNWMVDEILWRSGLDPRLPAGKLGHAHLRTLWKNIRFVCRAAMKSVGRDFSDPPSGWLFHQRWSRNGHCPADSKPLQRATIGGRTTAWCPVCQPPHSGSVRRRLVSMT